MARIRTIKPDFFKNYKLYQAEKESGLPLRIAFAGLWTVCDREGRFKWRPEELKIDCLPYDDIDFSLVLDALFTRGYLVKYMSEDNEFLGFIPSWKQHQHINNRESASILSTPSESTIVTRDARVDYASCVCTRGKERKGKERKEVLSGFLKTKIPDDRPFLKISFSFWELFRKITLEANSKTTILDKANAREWENQVRIMLQKKEVTEEELRKIYTWLDKRKTKNAQFWAKNIKSTATLREKIPKILEQINSEKPEENEQSHVYKKDKVETKYPGVLKANKRDEKIKSIGELMK